MVAGPAGALTSAQFDQVRDFLLRRTGIQLKPGKEALVTGRLERRLRHHGLENFGQYLELLRNGHPEEQRIAVDLLTTNETYFFREPAHLELLPRLLADRSATGPVRVWSAASSSGEEAYSIALVLAASQGSARWEIVGTDISSTVLEKARRGLYPIDAADKVPSNLLREYCLRGSDRYEGYFTVKKELRSRVRFQPANLVEALPDLGTFDVVFLRNVMIYFGDDTKRALLARIADLVRPGGHLLIGHAESITGLSSRFSLVTPSVYRVVP